MPSPSFQDLSAALEGLGWSLDGIEPPSSSTPKYTATGTGPDGVKKRTVEGPTPEFALGSLVAFAQRHNQIRAYASIEKTSAWDLPWENQLEEIGKAYGQLPVFDPKAVPHWRALAQESKIQADAIRKQLKVNVTDDPEPYPHVGAMIHDIHHKQNFNVSRAHSDHPVMSVPDTVNFRIVHDVLGHGQTGGDFGWNGENKACSIHFPMVSRMARPALFTECIGQTAYALRKGSHGFGPQKVGVMPQFLEPVEKMNGEHVYIPHGKFAYPEEIMGQEGAGAGAWGWYQDPQTGIWKQDPNVHADAGEDYRQMDKASSRERIVLADATTDLLDPETGENLWNDEHEMFRGKDPNQDYVTPADVTQRGAGSIGHPDYNGDVVRAGSPSDYLDRSGTYNNTAKMVVPWWERDSNGAWKYPVKEQERIILNALRVCLLSPLKHLKWNAAHYQGIADMPVAATGREMWDKLDGIRRRHNKQAGFDEDEHLGYYKEIKVLAGFIQYETGVHKQEALKDAKQQVHAKVAEFEQELTAQNAAGTLKLEGSPGEWQGDDEDTDEWGITPLRIYLTAHQMVDSWLRDTLAQRSPESHADRPEAEQMTLAKLQKEAAEILGWADPNLITPGTRIQSPGGGWAAINDQKHEQGFDICPLCSEPIVPGQHPRNVCPNKGWRRFSTQMGLEGVTPTKQKGKKYEKYAGFMGAHLDNIANVAKYVPELRQAALKDIYTDGGRGFIFRNAFMNLKREYGITGVNPKVISFVWLMLYPEGSDLGIVDTHVARAFNRNYNEIGSLKDYYKVERMQKAVKDASGYPDMPLGTFHHGMWDMVRAKDWKKGWEHSDHSPLAVDQPEPWDTHPWDMDTGNAKMGNWTGPQPFEHARPLAEDVAGRYEAAYAGQSKNRIPYDVLEEMAGEQKAAGLFGRGKEPRPDPWMGWRGRRDEVRTPGGRLYRVISEPQGGDNGESPQYGVTVSAPLYMNDDLPGGWHDPKADTSVYMRTHDSDTADWLHDMALQHVQNGGTAREFGNQNSSYVEPDQLRTNMTKGGEPIIRPVPTPPLTPEQEQRYQQLQQEADERVKGWMAPEQKTASTDPDYMFVFYQGGLVVEPYDSHPNVKNMAERLLKDFGYPSGADHDVGPGTSDMRLWSAGDIWGDGDHIQITQLSDPEVADDARQAVRAYFEADTEPDGHAVVVAPDDGEWEVQEPGKTATQQDPATEEALEWEMEPETENEWEIV